MMPAPNGRVAPTPRRIRIEITSKCNLRCQYCSFFDSSAERGPDLQTEDWLSFFDELGYLSVMVVTLSGGEPFARRDLPVLLDGIVRNRMRFNIFSNGALIHDSVASFIANTGRCDSVQISLDGSKAGAHDSARGPGAFSGALRGISTLRRHNIQVITRYTIHRENLNDLDHTARWALDDLGSLYFSTNAASYLGNCRKNTDRLILSPAERERAMVILDTLQQEYPGRVLAAAGPGADVTVWRRMLQAQRSGAAPFQAGGRMTACGCPTVELSVLSDGTVVPCHQLPHVAMGRANRDPLAEIWSSHPKIQALRNRKNIPLSQFPECNGCDFMSWCTGSCPATAYTFSGGADYFSQDSCLRHYLAKGGRVPGACERLPVS